MPLDLSKLIKTRMVLGKEETSVIPVLAITLYSEMTLHGLAPALGKAIQMFVDFIPPDTLQSCWIGDKMKKLSAQTIKRNVGTLGKLPKHIQEVYLLYSQGATGAPGTYGALGFADEFERDEPSKTNLLRLEFPSDFAEADRGEAILNFATAVLNAFPCSVGSIGFGFSFHIFDRFARAQVNAMLPRYLGFDASAESCRLFMRGRTPTANWVNILGEKALKEVGGLMKLENVFPKGSLMKFNGGVMARASRMPPVGDTNTGAADIGMLPKMSALLRESRYEMQRFRWAEKGQVDAWQARFDTLESKDWDNR